MWENKKKVVEKIKQILRGKNNGLNNGVIYSANFAKKNRMVLFMV